MGTNQRTDRSREVVRGEGKRRYRGKRERIGGSIRVSDIEGRGRRHKPLPSISVLICSSLILLFLIVVIRPNLFLFNKLLSFCIKACVVSFTKSDLVGWERRARTLTQRALENALGRRTTASWRRGTRGRSREKVSAVAGDVRVGPTLHGIG